ncbi:MAG TPA: tRNA threonylcarbamoyladenosine dehydratase [Anaerovoracaceae bacterium]|nr:tRNA threonylcarbamoyladenosine dehydratase [Anaerovoracaceae bacterium]
MKTIFDRTRMLLGTEFLNRILSKKIIVFGVGGVGGFVVEALVRAGIQSIAIVDYDIVDITDINRQIIALHSTVGRKKVEVMAERIKDINPDAEVLVYAEKLIPDNLEAFHLDGYDYIVDAIDDVPAKLLLIREAKEKNIPIISSMGTGNKFDPSQFRIDDIKKANTCPLAKVIRKETAKMGIKHLKVLYSTEAPHREELPEDGSRSASSISFVPATAGLLIASAVIKDLLQSAPTDRMIFGIKMPAEKIKVDF